MNKLQEKKPKNIRENNLKLVLNYFLETDVLTVSDLEKSINLSKTTILKIIEHLSELNLIIEYGKGNSTSEGGRKPLCYSFNDNYGYCISFHIFPDELYSIITTLKNNILQTYSIPISPDIDLEEILKLIFLSVNSLVKMQGTRLNSILGIAIGSHGLTDVVTGTISISPHFKKWPKNVAIKSMLSILLPEVDYIIVDNQIRFQVLSEKIKGCAHGKENIVVIEAGVGLAAGIIVKNEIKRGSHSYAGEIGHMILSPYSDEVCSCGARGCFEAMVSTERLLRIVKEEKSINRDSILFRDKKDGEINIIDIFTAANKGDEFSMKIVDEAANWFAIGITNTVLMYDPEVIVIQGVYSNGGRYFLDSIYLHIKKNSPILENIQVEVSLSSLGKNRGVIGGSSLISQNFFSTII